MIISSHLVETALHEVGYIPTEEIISAVWNVLNFNESLLIEGEPGSGKSELAKAVARIIEGTLIYCECHAEVDYDDLFYQQALSPTNFPALDEDAQLQDVLTRMKAGPVVRAFLHPTPVVLLLDEIDKLSRDCSNVLLRVLADRKTTLFGWWTISPLNHLYIIATSNGRTKFSREFLDRFCYLSINLPTKTKEMEILRHLYPQVAETLIKDIAECMLFFRSFHFENPPSLRAAKRIIERAIQMNLEFVDRELLNVCRSLLVKTMRDQLYLNENFEALISFVEQKRHPEGLRLVKN